MPNDSPLPDTPELTLAGKRVVTVLRWSRRGSVRFVVFVTFAFVSMLALLWRTREARDLWVIALVLTAAFVFWPFVQGTFLLHKNGSANLRAGYKVEDNPSLNDLPDYRIKELESLGFEFVGCLRTEKTEVTSHTAFFFSPETNDSAYLAKVQGSLETTHLVVFATPFNDGTIVETTDSRRAPIFRPLPRVRIFRFPQIRNTGDLYRLHLSIKSQYLGLLHQSTQSADQVPSRFVEIAEETYAFYKSQGDYQLNASADGFVYTWRGAARVTSLLTWPVDSIRAIRVATGAEKKAKQLGFRINPKFGRIESL